MKKALIKSLPILCSYLFIGMAYGMLMTSAGFAWYYPLLISLTVYTGAFQFVLVTLLSSTASILTIALTAFFILKHSAWNSCVYGAAQDFVGNLQKGNGGIILA